jgi:hypothetical protein
LANTFANITTRSSSSPAAASSAASARRTTSWRSNRSYARRAFGYFVFPSIDWEPKGPRLARLVENVGLRPPTVLFIDDNPSDRAEAMAAVPGLRVADVSYIAEMLADPLLRGKDDAELQRLKQYKLLERRKRDERAASGANGDFLRASDIRVEYYVAKHIDRAIELISRTNHLNYTERRLPDDPAEARTALLEQLQDYIHQAAVVRLSTALAITGFAGFTCALLAWEAIGSCIFGSRRQSSGGRHRTSRRKLNQGLPLRLA